MDKYRISHILKSEMKTHFCPLPRNTRKTEYFVAAVGVSLLLGGQPAWSASASSSAQGSAWPELEYPELLVVPRASARIELEKAREKSSQWTRLAPMQLGSLTLLTAGTTFAVTAPSSTDDERKNRLVGSIVSIGTGGAWLIATTALNAFYFPYETASLEVGSTAQGASKREVLTRERLAEESIRSAARVGKVLQWTYGLSQAAASLTLLSNNSLSENPVPSVMASGALIMSLAPVIFPTRWQTVHREQDDYKKRIFTPVASAFTVLPPARSGESARVLSSFRWEF